MINYDNADKKTAIVVLIIIILLVAVFIPLLFKADCKLDSTKVNEMFQEDGFGIPYMNDDITLGRLRQIYMGYTHGDLDNTSYGKLMMMYMESMVEDVVICKPMGFWSEESVSPLEENEEYDLYIIKRDKNESSNS